MSKIKTNKELLVEFRNSIASRVIENMANLKYWQKVASSSKELSEEKREAREKVVVNENSIEKDEIFLKIIDQMIRKEN